MPSITFAEAASPPVDAFALALDKLARAPVTGWGASVTFLVTGPWGFEVQGSGLTYAVVDGIRLWTGGTITAILVNHEFIPALALTGLSLNAAALQAAITADASRQDSGAVEALFGPLGWSYTGQDGRDLLPEVNLGSDSAPLNLSGNDTVDSGGGADQVWLGAGNDLGSGGSGADQLDGGTGNDGLSGDSGNDTLTGEAGSDALTGGTGNDSLNGGNEVDRLTGGRGADILSGGTGRDVFVFAARDGADQITDFQIGLDQIDLAPGVRVTFTEQGNDSLLTYGNFGSQILLIGIDIGETDLITLI